jgi:F-type H+-transporting ATPase subunit b
MTPPNVSLVLIMVCFWITLWLVYRFLIRPVGATLDERGRRIASAQQEWTARNEDFSRAVAEVEESVQNAAKNAAAVRAEARQQAMDRRQEALEGVRGQADARLTSVLETLESDADAARAELRRRAGELARLLAGRLLGREMGS